MLISIIIYCYTVLHLFTLVSTPKNTLILWKISKNLLKYFNVYKNSSTFCFIHEKGFIKVYEFYKVSKFFPDR